MTRNILIAFCIALASGCSSVKVRPKTFSDFQAAVKGAGEGIGDSLEYGYKCSREDFAKKLSREKDLKFGDLILNQERNEDKKLWAANPVCIQIKNANSAIEGINQAVEQYASILAKLSAGEYKEAEDLEFAAEALNMDLRNAIQKAEFPKDSDAGDLFTAEAVASAKAYVGTKRPESLGETLEKSQKPLEMYCKICANLAAPVRSDMKAGYVKRAEALTAEWNAAQTPERKEALLAELLELNDRQTAFNEMFDGIQSVYDKIPKIHQTLRKAIFNKAFYYEELQALNSEAQKIKRLCEKLKKK